MEASSVGCTWITFRCPIYQELFVALALVGFGFAVVVAGRQQALRIHITNIMDFNFASSHVALMIDAVATTFYHNTLSILNSYASSVFCLSSSSF